MISRYRSPSGATSRRHMYQFWGQPCSITSGLATTCLGDVKTDAVHFEVAVVDSGNLG
jgi:hypothetical protein